MSEEQIDQTEDQEQEHGEAQGVEEQGDAQSPESHEDPEKARMASEIRRLRDEAAKNRIGKREAVEQNKTLEDRVKELEEAKRASELNAARVNVAREFGLPADLEALLGDDLDGLRDRAQVLSAHVGQAPEPGKKPVNPKSLTGGLEPAKEATPFDVGEVLRKHRKR